MVMREWKANSAGFYGPAAALAFTLFCVTSEAGVKWKTDYDDTLRQARLSGKPVMVWFMDRRVGWCSKFEATTLSNPNVVGLAGKFLCLKIDRSFKPRLVEQHAVDKVSTTVFLDHRGKEITRIQGNVSVQKFRPVIEKVADRFGTPVRSKEYVSAKRGLEMGIRLFDRGHYRGALVQFEWAKRFGVKTDGIAEKIDGYLEKIEAMALVKREAAEKLLRDGRIKEGLEGLKGVETEFQGTKCAGKAAELLCLLKKDRTIRRKLSDDRSEDYASRLLEKAIKAYRGKRYLRAYEAYSHISRRYADTAAGCEAGRRLGKMKGRRWVMSQVAKQRRDRECVRQMSLARSWVINGDVEKARRILSEVTRKYSRTKLGRQAKKELKALDSARSDGMIE
jgi:thioredoxin-like negative regulator of GroEL